VTERNVSAVRTLARMYRLLESADSGLTLPQYRVLAAISQGGSRSAHLADRLSVRRPTLTAIADGLVAAGYATREAEAGDRRVVQLHVTDAGRAALTAADGAYLAKLVPLIGELADPERFVDDLLAIGAVLDERLRVQMTEKEPHE
jgi:DNA-binding MarR family transcriptional regulator